MPVCPAAWLDGPGRAANLLRLKTNSETCVTIRIRRQTPLIVGRRPRHRYELCRKYRECRKFPADANVACTRPSASRAEERALSFLSPFRRQGPAAASDGRIKLIKGLPGFAEKRGERDPVHHNTCGAGSDRVDELVMSRADCGPSPNTAGR